MTVYDLIGEGLAAHKLVSSRIELEEKVEAIMENAAYFRNRPFVFPISFPADRDSVSVSPERWPPVRSLLSVTKRYPRWMSLFRRKSLIF